MSRARSKLSAFVLAACVLATACGGGGDGEAAPSTVPDYDVSEGVGSEAATLRAELTALLQEHALLVGMASAAMIGGTDPAPATAALDRNSAALGAVVTGLYGAAGPAFLDAWRRHTAALVAFAPAAASGDKAVSDQAEAALAPIQEEIAGVLNGANPQLTVDDLTEALDGYARSVQSGITAQAEGDASAPSKLKEAADQAAATAIVLAAGIVKHQPDAFNGALDSTGAAMRAELASKLQEHAYLAGLAGAAVVGGGDPEPVGDALEENSLELSRVFGTVYGDDAQRRFLSLWREHVDLLGAFSTAARSGDAPAMDGARRDLDANRRAVAGFLAELNPIFAASEVEQELGTHVDTLLAAVAAEAAGDPDRVAKLREAAGHMPGTALYLATGIARQFPAKFG